MRDVLVVLGIGGMGEAVARRLGSGQRVVLADFNEESLERVGASLRGEGFFVETFPVDVSSKDSVRALAQAAAQLGDVRQVAHTAGLSPVQASAEAILSVDLVGVAFSLDAFGEVIAPGGAGVVIASMAGTLAAGQLPAEMEAALADTPADDLLTLPFLQGNAVANPGAAYGIAKRANQLRVQTASSAWGVRGARVNSISPGIISSAIGQAELGGVSGASIRAMIENSGTQRIGTAADIAEAAAFLLGPASTFITGTDLLVDGGVVAAFRSGAGALRSA